MRTILLVTLGAVGLLAPLPAGASPAQPLPFDAASQPAVTLVACPSGLVVLRTGRCGRSFGSPRRYGYYRYYHRYGFYR